jgi:hypothetical protein
VIRETVGDALELLRAGWSAPVTPLGPQDGEDGPPVDALGSGGRAKERGEARTEPLRR